MRLGTLAGLTGRAELSIGELVAVGVAMGVVDGVADGELVGAGDGLVSVPGVVDAVVVDPAVEVVVASAVGSA
ncbi:hypothetical protein [Propionicimonas paludicola]|uniref:hypothetical protein n=1 Tax=Propionicimonas paludicola TaxID=185243 RepID=UPI00147527D2|nr:hypothetical protein [Propionicimonas paludicola]